MVLGLSRLFGSSPEFWLNAQRAVDLWDAGQAIRSDVGRRRHCHPPEAEVIQTSAAKLNSVDGYSAEVTEEPADEARHHRSSRCST